jgi:hypothetical protein
VHLRITIIEMQRRMMGLLMEGDRQNGSRQTTKIATTTNPKTAANGESLQQNVVKSLLLLRVVV